MACAEANTHGDLQHQAMNNLGSENGIAGVDRILGRFLVIWQRHPGTRTPSHYPAAGQNASRFSREVFPLWCSELSMGPMDSAPCRFT